MKKTVVALVVSSLFASTAWCKHDVNLSTLDKNFKVVEMNGKKMVVNKQNNSVIGYVHSSENGKYKIIDNSENFAEIDAETGDYAITRNGESSISGKILDDTRYEENRNNGQNNADINRNREAHEKAGREARAKWETKQAEKRERDQREQREKDQDRAREELDKDRNNGQNNEDINKAREEAARKAAEKRHIDEINKREKAQEAERQRQEREAGEQREREQREQREKDQDRAREELDKDRNNGQNNEDINKAREEAARKEAEKRHIDEINKREKAQEAERQRQEREAAEQREREQREQREKDQDRTREELDKDRNNGQKNDDIDIERDKAKISAETDKKIWEAGKHIENAANAAYKEAVIVYNDLDNRISENTKRIDSLEQDMVKMGNKMLDLEDRMDGVVATSHAITNARPMVQDAGEFAMGVGIGAAGSKQALALGGAYQFNANWSSSMTVNYETAGKRSNSQVSAGAGVQYRFK